MPERGRPTSYSDETLKKAESYLKVGWQKEGDVIPTIEGLALCLGISRETVYAWSKQEEKKDFSDIVERIMSKQGKTLANGGLKGELNPTITKLMMAKHGYKESNEVDLTSGGDKVTSINYIVPENAKKSDS